MACNAPVQMGAQGVIKQAMGDLTPIYQDFRRQGYVWNPLIQIHDDILSEVDDRVLPVVTNMAVWGMEYAVRLSIPVLAEPKVGKRWGSLEKIRH